MKDKKFFKSVVLPHLANKIELTLVDMFLLGQSERILEKFCHLEVLCRLNVLELIIIVLTLV